MRISTFRSQRRNNFSIEYEISSTPPSQKKIKILLEKIKRYILIGYIVDSFARLCSIQYYKERAREGGRTGQGRERGGGKGLIVASSCMCRDLFGMHGMGHNNIPDKIFLESYRHTLSLSLYLS